MKNILYTIILSFLFSSVCLADFQAAHDAYAAGDYETAFREIKPLAEQGDVDAQFTLGAMYARGEGITQNFKEAVKWYRLAAEQGNARAQFYLGGMYDGGLGITQNFKEAAEWYRLAAEQGDVDAQNRLGLMYTVGRGVIQDYILAHMWFNISSSNGNEVAKKGRDGIQNEMTPEQLAKAQELARECVEKNYKDCG
jgi:TPR repeat protein